MRHTLARIENAAAPNRSVPGARALAEITTPKTITTR